jgi:ATP/maltotriose-dependent transcriptional regulator MalT
MAVTGDPGIGKTRLLTELARQAERDGWTVLWGHAAEFEQQVPFAIIRDALANHLADADPGHLDGLTADDASLLREILPMLPVPAIAGASPQLLRAERYRLYRAARSLLEVLAKPSGLLLVFDDLHWADPGSAELLDHLLRHPPRGRVRLAVSYRSRQLSGLLRRCLAGAARDGTVRLIELGPLTAAEADELLPRPLDDAQRRQLYEASGGNPFYLQALVRAGATNVDARPAGGDQALPDLVRVALAAELDLLSPVEELVAWASAVVGDGADPELVGQAAAIPADDVLVALDALVQRDLLRAIPHTSRFQFRHPLVRHVVYDAAGAGWRIAAHARVAAALRQSGAPAADQAHHLERSARRGDLAAMDMLREAATGAMHSSPAAAAHWLGAALRLIPDDPGYASRRLELLSLRAQALSVTGQPRESRAALHDLLVLLPPALIEERARLAGLCAAIERLFGRHAEANAILLAELANLPDQDGPAAVTLMVGLASGASLGTCQDGQDWPERALAAARRHPDRPALVAALTACVVAEQLAGRIDSTVTARLHEAADLVDGMPDGELARLLYVTVWLAIAELCDERPYDAIRHVDRALRLARTTGQTYVVGQLHTLRGCAHEMTGDLDETGRCFDDAIDAAALLGMSGHVGIVVAYQANLAVMQGDADLAVRLAEQAVSIVGRGTSLFATSAAVSLAQAHLLAGDPAACLDVLLGTGGAPELATIDPMTRNGWYEILARADAALGNTQRALDWADRAQAAVEAWPSPRRRGSAHLARAHALLSTDPAAAVVQARAALDAYAPYDRLGRGRAHLVAGTALAATAEQEAARQEFALARKLLEACGAHLFVAQTVREERRMNARRPRRSRHPADPTEAPERILTERELHVARLVTRGLTNREIAQTLFLSPKTVDVHLTRVYAKLGVTRRGAVAERLARIPPVDEDEADSQSSNAGQPA